MWVLFKKKVSAPIKQCYHIAYLAFLRPTQTMPVAMTQADINEVNAAFAQAAADSKAVGFYVEAPFFISQFQN
jgi:2,4-dienoyl-CoA reductase-like NADH-dependent reductase (Old Yellow Enzyme family)